MLAYSDTKIQDVVLHYVGNSFNEELLTLGNTKLQYSDEVEEDLLTYFLSSFKENEYYRFHHESHINLNEVFAYAEAIFTNPEDLVAHSRSISKHLYEQGNHPKIKGGEFYVAYIKDVLLEGEAVDAIGLFKSEVKDTFLDVLQEDGSFSISSQEGIHIKKLDKGAIIFNSEKEKGYTLSVIDNTNKGGDAKFWFDLFLHVKQREDAYYQTETVMNLAKEFITKELPKEFAADKADQADMLNKSADYFKEQEQFDLSEFANVVLQQPDIVDTFQDYTTSYQRERAVSIPESFDLNETAVNKKKGVFKSVIKLDKNFSVYVHGDRNKIERGEDENGRKYYTLWFDEER
ncbi:nucleoid-associated protein [Bacteroidia bacterium]|nr:nucleoid-associated protein [Bacteroidia bacterium]